MKRFGVITFLAISLTFNLSYGFSKKLTSVINKIVKINEVQEEFIGIGGQESENYKNFKELKKIAATEELVKLTESENATVACYASWALVDNFYPNLEIIFQKFMLQGRPVETLNGCIGSESNISTEIYHRYWNSVNVSKRADDYTLFKLDSIILFNKNSNWLLLFRALENRVYDEPLKSQISFLAFEQGKREAIFYLCNWHKAEYRNKIKAALVQYLIKNDFRLTGVNDYYNTIYELLKFNDHTVRKEIISKMKKDKHWEYEKERFHYLLSEYNVYSTE